MTVPHPTGSEEFAAQLEALGVPGIDYLDDNADEAMASFPAMKRRCVECPYTDGTETSRDPITRPLSRECTAVRHAFWCHKSGRREFRTHLCAGWIESIRVTGSTDVNQP